MNYDEFIDGKTSLDSDDGFEPLYEHPALFDFQSALVAWALRKGRAALFEDCGLGKTVQQLVWADNVVKKTNKPVLILTPLAVSFQTVEEAGKFGIDAVRSSDGKFEGARIIVTNYERLHHFDPNDFSGVVCDESSILKNFDGATRGAITQFMFRHKYRLLCTATAAPNDFTELGTSSEALGYLGHMDMLSRFFKNDQSTCKPMRNGIQGRSALDSNKWRLKGHAELPFWRWVCSWARAIRKPSDIGFDDSKFKLPPLVETEHNVKADRPANGMLFTFPAVGLQEQRSERSRTLTERCERAADILNHTEGPVIAWCHLNHEGDTLEKMITGSVQISGKDSDDEKESSFMGFVRGDIRAIVTKPSIGAFGLNFQHCSNITTFPSHSFEQYYQSVRRCWRFGQKSPVNVNIIASDGELGVLKNLKRKSAQADVMFENLVSEMNRAISVKETRILDTKTDIPAWL